MKTRKKYNIFLSHSSKDNHFTDKLYSLFIKAGLTVWYAENSMLANASITSELPVYISNCETLIVILSNNSVQSNWVAEEYNYAKELYYAKQLKIIPIVIDDCTIPGFYNNYTWIDCREGINSFCFFRILSAVYGTTENCRKVKDIYVSYPWREEEQDIVEAVFSNLSKGNYRLIGDAVDQFSYDGVNRIKRIMMTCGAFVGILPYREATITSKYILDEVHQAISCGLPGLIIADNRVDGLQKIPYPIFRFDNPKDITDSFLKNALITLDTKSPKMTHVFYATKLDPERNFINFLIRNLSGIVTATPCVFGEDINLGNLQSQIVNRIRSSYVMIADITDECFNTCIEAGIARGAGCDLYLVAKNQRHTPPFMFRDINVFYYNDDCELLAIIHRVLRPYRRKILNIIPRNNYN